MNPLWEAAAQKGWVRYQTAITLEGQEPETAFKEVVAMLLQIQEERFQEVLLTGFRAPLQ